MWERERWNKPVMEAFMSQNNGHAHVQNNGNQMRKQHNSVSEAAKLTNECAHKCLASMSPSIHPEDLDPRPQERTDSAGHPCHTSNQALIDMFIVNIA